MFPKDNNTPNYSPIHIFACNHLFYLGLSQFATIIHALIYFDIILNIIIAIVYFPTSIEIFLIIYSQQISGHDSIVRFIRTEHSVSYKRLFNLYVNTQASKFV